MDIKHVFELINDNPAVYFLAGILLGYLLRTYQTKDGSSRTKNRYQSIRTEKPLKRPEPAADSKEPSFDWSEAAVNSIAARSLGKMSFDQPRDA